MTVFAVTYVVSSPLFVTLAGGVAPRCILVAAIAVFALANAAAVVAPAFGLLLCRVLAVCGAAVFTPTALARCATRRHLALPDEYRPRYPPREARRSLRATSSTRTRRRPRPRRAPS